MILECANRFEEEVTHIDNVEIDFVDLVESAGFTKLTPIMSNL